MTDPKAAWGTSEAAHKRACALASSDMVLIDCAGVSVQHPAFDLCRLFSQQIPEVTPGKLDALMSFYVDRLTELVPAGAKPVPTVRKMTEEMLKGVLSLELGSLVRAITRTVQTDNAVTIQRLRFILANMGSLYAIAKDRGVPVRIAFPRFALAPRW